jgi:hypothetical protein
LFWRRRRDGGRGISPVNSIQPRPRLACGAVALPAKGLTGLKICPDQPPPKGFARWNGPLIAKALGDVDAQYVWRSLRKQKIDLGGRKSWCESKDPEFAAKAADVVGLYLAPPENAVVLCVDEKPSIQALDRAQGYLSLPNGRTLTAYSHDFKRSHPAHA